MMTNCGECWYCNGEVSPDEAQDGLCQDCQAIFNHVDRLSEFFATVVEGVQAKRRRLTGLDTVVQLTLDAARSTDESH